MEFCIFLVKLTVFWRLVLVGILIFNRDVQFLFEMMKELIVVFFFCISDIM